MAAKNRPTNLASIQTIADEYGLAVITIRKWIYKGELTAYRVGARAIRIDRDEFAQLMVKRVGATSRN